VFVFTRLNDGCIRFLINQAILTDSHVTGQLMAMLLVS